MTTPTPLHGVYAPPTRIERELFRRTMEKLWKDEALPMDTIATELVALGVPTLERARIVCEAHFMPGGPPTMALGMLIAKHASEVNTPELMALIDKHLPGTPIPDIIAECRRQAEFNNAGADALEAYSRAG